MNLTKQLISEGTPRAMGHYLVEWDSDCSRKFPTICTKFNVLFWDGLKWWAPVSTEQPVIAFYQLPEE